MSLYDNALSEVTDLENGFQECVKAWDFVRRQINFAKFRYRAKFAHDNPAIPTKMVLLEYEGSSVNFRDAQILHYLHYMIANNDPTILVYTRRKIMSETREPHPTLRQLVVQFNYKEQDIEQPPPIPQEPDIYIIQEELDI